MSIITKIEEQKNKKRVNIFVDNAFFCGLNKETAVIFGLKTGKSVDEETLKTAVFESEVKSAFDKASDYLGLRMHTKKELFEKLLKKNYEKPVIEKAIEKLEEYRYFDDLMFAKQFVVENSKYSKKVLDGKLRQKGVNPDVIESVLQNIEDEDEFELCKKYAEKYSKGKDFNDKKNVEKLMASLLRRGFSFEMIKKATKSIVLDDDFN